MALSTQECQLISVHSDKALDLLDDKAVIRSADAEASNQQWRITPLRGDKDGEERAIGEHEYAIKSMTREGKCLSEEGGSRNHIVLSDYSGAAHQRWRITPVTGQQGEYRIENVKHRHALDVSFARKDDNTKVTGYRWHGRAHQRWRLQPLPQDVKTGGEEKTAEELRDDLRDRGLKVSGKKDELVARLHSHDAEATARLAQAQAESEAEAGSAGHREMTAEQLRDELRDRGLKVSGSKAELVDRLRRNDSKAAAATAQADTDHASPAESETEEDSPGEADTDQDPAAEAATEQGAPAEAQTEQAALTEPEKLKRTLEDLSGQSADLDVSALKDEVMDRLREHGGAGAADEQTQPRTEPRTGGRMPTARQRTTDRLVQIVGQYRYPSHQVLDRLERSLRTRSDLEAYALILSKITESQRYPSLRVLDRLECCALAHELAASTHMQDDDGAGCEAWPATMR